jgi:hypothetical protein
LVAVLGSQAARDATFKADAGLQALLISLTAFPAWNTESFGSDSGVLVSIALKVLVLSVCTFLAAMLAGRAESAGIAILAGWGGFVVSSAIAGAVFAIALDVLAYDGSFSSSQGGLAALTVQSANRGAEFALYTGVLIGGAVAIARQTATRTSPAVAPPGWGMFPSTGPGGPQPQPPPPPPPVPVMSWPPSPAQPSGVTGTGPPSPAWTSTPTPLPASPLPRRGGLPAREPTAEPTEVHPGVEAPSEDEDPTKLQ